jgi:hypothetical protein
MMLRMMLHSCQQGVHKSRWLLVPGALTVPVPRSVAARMHSTVIDNNTSTLRVLCMP